MKPCFSIRNIKITGEVKQVCSLSPKIDNSKSMDPFQYLEIFTRLPYFFKVFPYKFKYVNGSYTVCTSKPQQVKQVYLRKLDLLKLDAKKRIANKYIS